MYLVCLKQKYLDCTAYLKGSINFNIPQGHVLLHFNRLTWDWKAVD
jgi:hypothetical protein